MIKITLKTIILLVPIVIIFGAYELVLRDSYKSSDYFLDHDRFKLYPKLLQKADVIILGNSVSHRALNPDIVSSCLQNKCTIYNLSRLGGLAGGSAHVLTQLEYIESLNLTNKIIVIYIDAKQWASIKPDLNVVKDDTYKAVRDYNMPKLYAFKSYWRIEPNKLGNLTKAIYHYLITHNRNEMLISLNKFNDNLLWNTNAYFNYKTGWLGIDVTPKKIIKNDYYIKRIPPKNIGQPWAYGRLAQEQLSINLTGLKKIIDKNDKNHRFVLLRLPQNEKLINSENADFPEIVNFIESSRLPFIDLTYLNVPLFDGVHAEVEQSSIISREFAKKIALIL